MTKRDIISLIEQDTWMMEILETVKELNLPDWWIGAGFVRSKVWDKLHGYKERTPIPDIDVIYFNKNDFSEDEVKKETTKQETLYEQILKKNMPTINWSVTNQARMHVFHHDQPYNSSAEALARWVETATCVGVKLHEKNNMVLIAPWGIDDLVNCILRPTSGTNDMHLFNERIRKKRWLKKWPKLKMFT